MTFGIGGANLNLLNQINLGESVEFIQNEELTVEEYVRSYFSDVPVLAEVAKCESHFRQHDSKGRVLVGEVNRYDYGVMQINELYHGERADKLGFDTKSLEGNTAYGRYLFEKEGLKPWSSSSKCWKKSEAYVQYRTSLALNI